MLGQHKRAVGVFSNYRDAEVALTELKNSGFSMDNVSVVARDADKGNDIAGADVSDRVGNKADEGAKAGAVTGGTLGGLTGLLVGLGALAIPGLGPVMLAGAAGTAIATTLSGGAIGAAAGSLLGALIGLGIPEERARHYSDRVSRGDYLVMVDGSDDDIRRAEAILSHRGIQDWGIYDAPATNTTTTTTTRTSDIADPSGTYQTPVVDPTPRTDTPVQIIDRREQTL
ncbi:general stress protein [Coleofasciculus sp. FACHB-501]|uniref:general stress protein n=1 Tax=Cyanophyceae TaxID=3028117 RepID=UPI001F559127|nr:general stress protein [Coleofasciculus sp. FACHB-501]